MYALKMTKEMLMNLCYKILMKKNFLEKITEYQGICERRVRNHSDNTNIDKCDKKYLKGCDQTLPGFVCQRGEE